MKFKPLKIAFIAIFTIVISNFDASAQTPVTNKSELEGIFIFSDPVEEWDGPMLVSTTYATDCMWKARKKRCRGHDGICTKGHTKFDASDDLMEATMAVPDDEVGYDPDTAPKVPVTLEIGDEGGEVAIWIDEI